jgi:hypothetical protein
VESRIIIITAEHLLRKGARMNRRMLFCVSVAAALALTGATRADFMTSTTGAYDEVGASPSYTPYDVGDPGDAGYTLPDKAITGLDQFDPALGTLTGITLEIEADWYWQIDAYGQSVLDDSQPNSIDFAIDFIQIFIGYNAAGGSTFVLVSADESVEVYPYAEEFEGPAFDSNDNLGTLSGPVDITPQVDLNDFIGLGPVTSLAAFIAYPDGVDQFDIENLDPDETYADLVISLNGADVTLTYHYVPEPTTMALLGVGAAAIVRRRRVRR